MEVTRNADRLAAQDYKKYGCELRGFVKQLPALRAGEIMVGHPATSEGLDQQGIE